MSATFVAGRQWSLLTPLEWAVDGFDIKLVEGPSRKTDSELEEAIERNWEVRQAQRRSHGLFVEEPWPKTGYRGHSLDIERRVLMVIVSDANWKSMQGTHYNPEFFEIMLERHNHGSNEKLALPNAHLVQSFQKFIAPYLDGAIPQCSAVETKAGYPLGLRSRDVGLAHGTWHVPGGYLPGIGKGIYKTEVPLVNGKPIVGRAIFTPDVAAMADNARANLFKESGSMQGMIGAEVVYTGLIYEVPNHTVHFTNVVKTDLDMFGINWEHEDGKMRHFTFRQIPDLLNKQHRLHGGIYKGGEACLFVAYLREKGLGSLVQFPSIAKKSYRSTNR